MPKRLDFTDQFKVKVASASLQGGKSVQEIAAKHQLHSNQVSEWKRQAIDGMANVFSGGKQNGRRMLKLQNCMPGPGSWRLRTFFSEGLKRRARQRSGP